MRREGDGLPGMFLWWSTVGFVALAGALAFGDTYLISIINSPAGAPGLEPATILLAITNFAALTMPGAMLSWWLLVVLPRRCSASAGGCAGLLAVVLAVLSVCLAAFFFGNLLPSADMSLPIWEKLEAALTFWLFGLIFLFASPWGWEMFLVGIAAGALYGAFVGALARQYLPSAHEGRPAPSPAPANGDS